MSNKFKYRDDLEERYDRKQRKKWQKQSMRRKRKNKQERKYDY
jgi:hypothetical protein